MQLLIAAEPKPSPGKRERRPWNRLQLEYIAVKRYASLDISDMERYVIELQQLHREDFRI